jgi:iron-sulfur cluster repair protein YtfE (RIC family)
LLPDSASSSTAFLPSVNAERGAREQESETFGDVALVECVGAQLRRRLAEDHPALKQTLEDVAQLVQRKSFMTAAKRFGEFRLAEERHMNLEDKALFPIIERLMGPNEAVQRGEVEHRTIRQLIDAVAGSLSNSTLPEFLEVHRQLLATLSEHWQHEEELVSCVLKVSDRETAEEIASALRRC